MCPFSTQVLHQRIPHALHDRPVYLPLVRHGVVNRAEVVAVTNVRTVIAPVSGSTSTSATCALKQVTSGSLASVVMAQETGAPEAATAREATSWMGTPWSVALDEHATPRKTIRSAGQP